MKRLIRTTANVPNHVNTRDATAHIPQGALVMAETVDSDGIAWVPYNGETYAVFPTEYEPASQGCGS
jgi:hypothetical protein